MSKSGVLLMAHGTPSSMDEMPEYLRLVRGGRPPSPELVAEMRHNYEAIGGRSPLTDLTMRQAEALRDAARARDSRSPSACATGSRSSRTRSRISRASGVSRVIGIPLAPQFSTLSVGKYYAAASAGLARRHGARSRRFVSRAPAAAARVCRARPGGAPDAGRQSRVHRAQPAAAGHRRRRSATPTKCRQPHAGVAASRRHRPVRARVPERRTHAGAVDRPRRRRSHTGARGRGRQRFLVVPVGFVCDHTEILFDIDVQAKAAADAAGASLRRTESLNTSPTVHRDAGGSGPKPSMIGGDKAQRVAGHHRRRRHRGPLGGLRAASPRHLLHPARGRQPRRRRRAQRADRRLHDRRGSRFAARAEA